MKMALLALLSGLLCFLGPIAGAVIGIVPAPFGGHVQYNQVLAREMLRRGHKVIVMGSKVKYMDALREEMEAHPNATFIPIPMMLTGENQMEIDYEADMYMRLGVHTRSGDLRQLMPIIFQMMTRHKDASYSATYRLVKEHGIQAVAGDLMMSPTWMAVDQLRAEGVKVEGVVIGNAAPIDQFEWYHTINGKLDSSLGGRLAMGIRWLIIMTSIVTDILDGGFWGLLGFKGRQMCDLGHGLVGPDEDRKVNGTCVSDIPPFLHTVRHFPILWQYFPGLDHPQPMLPNEFLTGHLIDVAPPGSYKLLEPKSLLDWLTDSAVDYPEGVLVVSFGMSGVVNPDELRTIFAAFEEFPKLAVLWKTSYLNRKSLKSEEMKDFKLPANVRTESWVDPSMQALLQHPRVVGFVQHGGLSSPMEAFVSGKAVITLPLICDQKDNADRLANTGASCSIDLPVTTGQVTHCIRDLTQNRAQYEAKAAHLVKIYKAYGGPSKAADVVETVIEVGSEHLITPGRRGKRLSEPSSIPLYAMMGWDALALCMVKGLVEGMLLLCCWRRCCGGRRGGNKSATKKGETGVKKRQ